MLKLNDFGLLISLGVCECMRVYAWLVSFVCMHFIAHTMAQELDECLMMNCGLFKLTVFNFLM